jgi:anti-sigma B factor antagonist
MSSLELDVLMVGAQAQIAVRGEVDASTSAELHEKLVSLVAQGARDVLVDLTSTTVLDATGVDALVRAFKLLSALDGKLSVVCPHDHLLKVFDITALADDVPIYATVEEAASTR